MMALSDLARDRNGLVVGRYRLVHRGGLTGGLLGPIQFVDGVCEVDAVGNEVALERAVAAFGSAITIHRIDVPHEVEPRQLEPGEMLALAPPPPDVTDQGPVDPGGLTPADVPPSVRAAAPPPPPEAPPPPATRAPTGTRRSRREP